MHLYIVRANDSEPTTDTISVRVLMERLTAIFITSCNLVRPLSNNDYDAACYESSSDAEHRSQKRPAIQFGSTWRENGFVDERH